MKLQGYQSNAVDFGCSCFFIVMANISELIPIEERNGHNAVNARHLYAWLEIKKDFSDWMKAQIKRCDLVQDVDYQAFPQKVECHNGVGYTMRTEYALSIDAAKEVSMMSQTQKGKDARRYFIDCEQRLKSVTMTALPDFTNPAEAARAWAQEYEQKMIAIKRADEAEQQIVSLTTEIEQMQPKASYYDMILNNKSTIVTTQIALDYGMSAKAFNKILYELRIQHKVSDQWILYAPYISYGYVHSKPIEITRHNGRREIKYNTEWTQKGRLFLYDTLKKQGILPLIER